MSFKIATVCSGIGSPEQALKTLNVEHEIAFACEIDKYARQTYLANFQPNVMYEDMTKEEWDKPEQYADLFIGGIPCQAFSLAGKRLGELDPRGLLFYDFYRYVKNQQPKVFIIENVKGLLSDNNGNTFNNWCQLLGRSMNTHLNMFNHEDSLLYNLHFKVLNSKDFGVPQNRERVFLVGIRNDLPNSFRFPVGERLTKRLKDILEPVVDEKYYLSDTMLKNFAKKGDDLSDLQEPALNIVGEVNSSQDGQVVDVKGISQCLSAGHGNCPKIIEPTCVAMRGRGEAGNIQQQLEERRGRVGDQIANTLDTACNQAVVVNDPMIINPLKDKSNYGWHFEQNVYSDDSITRTIKSSEGSGNKPKVILNQRIRRLTPLECMRLQGFPDNFVKPCSDSQTYKQAGNSITTNVIGAILNNLLPILTEEAQAKVA